MKENLRGMEGRTRGSKLLYREVQKEKNREIRKDKNREIRRKKRGNVKR